jgi:integrative and conjugative element protein (TIGR02256 family)
MNRKITLRWKSKCGMYFVSLSDKCLKKMLKLARKHYPNEVGTSLIGSYSDDGFQAFVLDIVPLSSDSRGTSTDFYRGIKGLKKFFLKLQKTAGGNIHYVGEWHSHPDGFSEPSFIDDNNQLDITFDDRTNCPENILIILGGDLLKEICLGTYIYSRKRGKVKLFPE